MRASYQVRIPILNGGRPRHALNPHSPLAHARRGTLLPGDYRNLVEHIERDTRKVAQIKPGRRLGGGWMADCVSQRTSVSLCAECQHKYRDWYTKVKYNPRDLIELTDCDGCGQPLQLCRGYYSSLM